MKVTSILFLDLDGTVRHGKDELGHFVAGPEDVEIFEGVLDILRSYKERGWRIVTISNQGGIALGLADEMQINKSMNETRRLCSNFFDRMSWCHHHPNARAKNEDGISHSDRCKCQDCLELSVCLCRKPLIGSIVASMVSLSQETKEIYRPYACLFVGDREEDRQCAFNANIMFMDAAEWRKKGPLTEE